MNCFPLSFGHLFVWLSFVLEGWFDSLLFAGFVWFFLVAGLLCVCQFLFVSISFLMHLVSCIHSLEKRTIPYSASLLFFTICLPFYVCVFFFFFFAISLFLEVTCLGIFLIINTKPLFLSIAWDWTSWQMVVFSELQVRIRVFIIWR